MFLPPFFFERWSFFINTPVIFDCLRCLFKRPLSLSSNFFLLDRCIPAKALLDWTPPPIDPTKDRIRISVCPYFHTPLKNYPMPSFFHLSDIFYLITPPPPPPVLLFLHLIFFNLFILPYHFTPYLNLHDNQTGSIKENVLPSSCQTYAIKPGYFLFKPKFRYVIEIKTTKTN